MDGFGVVMGVFFPLLLTLALLPWGALAYSHVKLKRYKKQHPSYVRVRRLDFSWERFLNICILSVNGEKPFLAGEYLYLLPGESVIYANYIAGDTRDSVKPYGEIFRKLNNVNGMSASDFRAGRHRTRALDIRGEDEAFCLRVCLEPNVRYELKADPFRDVMQLTYEGDTKHGVWEFPKNAKFDGERFYEVAVSEETRDFGEPL